MLRFQSLLSRIVFLHVIALILTAILTPVILYWFLSSDVEDLQQRATRELAETLSQHIVRRPDGSLRLDLPVGVRDQYSEAYGRYAYAILDQAGQVLLSSRKERDRIFPPSGSASEIEFFEIPVGNRVFSGATLRKTIDGQHLRIQVAEDLSHRDVLIDDVVRNFIPQAVWITIPILLLLLITDIVIFRGAVQPLLRASEQARSIGPARIDVRLPVAEIPSEIRPLVIAVNHALDRLEEGFRKQREFAADAAHELRTPLAVLRTRIETLADKHAADALHRDIEGMSRVVSQLLDAAELETLLITSNETADLVAVCAEVAEFMAPLAIAQEKTLSLEAPDRPVNINGHAEMLRRAVRNLVENALHHTPKNSDVTITVSDDGTVGVLDEGPGVPMANREHLFQRFWRRDRKRVGSAGLGLSIVKGIVEAHGGTINVGNRPTGGAAFSMHFPVGGIAGNADKTIET